MTTRWMSMVVCGLLLAMSARANGESPWSDASYQYYPGDFDGDGLADVLYVAKSPDRSSGIILATRSDAPAQTWPANYLGIPWLTSAYTAVVADFNGDGRDDVFMQRTGAGDSYLLFAGEQGRISAIHQAIPGTHLGLGWTADQHALIAGDFNGDGTADLILQARTSSGITAVMLSDDNGQFVSGPHQTWDNRFLGLQWSADQANLHAGDFNGDARSDLLVQARPDADGRIPPEMNGVLLAQDTPPIFDLIGLETWDRDGFGADWSPDAAEILIGDFNNDGRSDIVLKAKEAGKQSYLLLGSGSGSVLMASPAPLSPDSPLLTSSARQLAATALSRSSGSPAGRVAALPIGGGGISAMSVVAPTAVGRTPGSFVVSSTGAANYSIPITVPPGVRGIQPNLAISYNSSSGNGLLGMGWHLSGLSQIERCRNTWAQDGNSNGVRLVTGNDGDRFCLDGIKLRLTGGTYGAAGSTYATEIETYARITASGTGPASFMVETKDGLLYEYGNTADSRIEVVGTSTPRVWALNKVSDRSGNTMTIGYVDDVANGSFRPNEILYTSNSGAGLTAKSRVSFVYESRTAADTLTGYFAGGKIKETNRLDRIETRYNNVLVRKYEIDYDNSTVSGRSRLTAVQECDKDNNCLAPTTVSWQDGQQGFGGEQIVAAPGVDSGLYSVPVDINGDGRMDLMYADGLYSWTYGVSTWKYVLATPSGFGSLTDSGISVTSSDAHRYSFALDYNSDGKEDLMAYRAGSTWQLLISTGAGFTTLDTGISASSTNVGGWAADVNGDGRDDFVYLPYSSGSLKVRLNNGAGFDAETTIFSSPPLNQEIGFWGAGKTNIMPVRANFNGDGKDDFILSELGPVYYTYDPETGNIIWVTYVDNIIALVSGVSGYTRVYLGDAAENITGYQKWRSGDFNGDGLTDVAFPSVNAINQAQYSTAPWMIHFGNGAGVTGPISTGIPWITSYDSDQVAVIDWDGDGRDDLLEKAGSTWRLLRSTGETFGSPVNSGIPTLLFRPASGSDVNGDGQADMVYSGPAGLVATEIRYRLHAGAKPDLATSVADGFGNNVSVMYAPLTDSTVYTKGSGAAYPEREFAEPWYVVKQHTATNGIGGTYSVSHTYEQARLNLAGRGYLGFGKRHAVDGRNNIKTTWNYRQDFPYIGAPSTITVKQQNGNNVSLTSNTWAAHTAGGSWQQTAFPYLNISTQTAYEVSASNPGIDGSSVVETKVTTTIGSGNYGTPSSIAVETRDVTGSPTLVRTLTTNNTLSHDTGNWCVGFVTQRAVTSAVPSLSAQTRTTQFVKDTAADKCRVQQEIVEPASAYTVNTAFGFDGFGNVATRTVSATGITNRVTSMNFGSEGVFPVQVTNAEGHVSGFAWNYGLGVLASATDPNGLTTGFQYDGFGRRTRENRPDGTATTWGFSGCNSGNAYCGTGDGNLVLQVSQQLLNTSAGVIRNDYQLLDRFEREKYSQSQLLSGALSTVATVYDTLGRVAQQSRPFIWGSSVYYTTFTYDLLGRPTKEERRISESNSSLQNFQYGYNKLVLTQTDPENKTTTQYLNAVGQTVQVTDAAGGNTSYTYDPFGNLLTARDPLNNTITNTYNIRGFKESTSDPDMGAWSYTYYRTGELYQQTDAKSQLTTFTYDRLGRPVTRVEPEGTTNFTWGVAAGSYNVGQLAGVSSPGGYAESYIYDNRSRLQQAAVTADGATYLTDYTYAADTGALDTVTYPEVLYPAGAGAITKARDWNTVLTGSPTGNLTIGAGSNHMLVVVVSWENSSAPATNITVGGQTPTSKVVSVNTGTSSRVGHDIFIFNQAKIAAMSGTAIAVTAGTYPAATKWSYATLAGVDQSAPTTTPGFKTATTGNTLAINNPAPQAADYSILVVTNDQNVNNLHTFPSGYTEKYDTNTGSAFSAALADRFNTAAGAVSVTKSTAGNRWLGSHLGFKAAAGASTSGGRFKVDYDYAYGLLQAVKDYTTPTTVYWRQTATNAAGQVTAEQFGNGLTTTSVYDAVTGWLGGRTTGATNQVQNLTYQWDKVGNLTQRRDVNLNLTETFAYDNLHRLDYVQLNSTTTMDLTYNAAGSLVGKTGVGTYTYPTQGTGSIRPHTPTAAGSVTYGYDANGNRTTRTAGGVSSTTTWYSYNLPNKIDKTTSGVVTSSAQFYYGAYRNRYKQVSITAASQPGQVMPAGTETTIYINGLFEKVAKPSGTSEFKHSIIANGQIVAVRTLRSTGTHDTRYLQKDHLGSVDAITNEAGAVVQKLSYDAFGQRRSATTWSGAPAAGDWTNIAGITHRGYTEHEGLDNVDLIHMNGRVYDPVLGQFTSADPYVQSPFNGQSLNRYAYVFNNPLSFTDPSGFETCMFRNDNYNQENCQQRLLDDINRQRDIDDTEIRCLGCKPPPGPIEVDMTGYDPIAGVDSLSYGGDAGAGGMPDAPSSGVNTGGGIGQGMINAAVPGAYYGGQSQLAWQQGRYFASGVLFAGALLEAGIGVFTLGESTAALSAARTVANTVPREVSRVVAARGGLVIGRGADLAKPGALRAGEYVLKWDSKLPNFKAEWYENAGRLREVMRQGNPIRDASVGNTGGIFLNAERALLTERGWTFHSPSGYWMPPGP